VQPAGSNYHGVAPAKTPKTVIALIAEAYHSPQKVIINH
jgi:hypothetical protein